VIATAKGRATGATWSPLHFDGFTFTECTDRGGRTVEAWKDAADKRAQVKEAKVQAKDAAKEARIVRDAAAVAAHVLAHPGRPVAEARVHAVGDSARRWKPAVAKLGAALQEGKRGKAMALTVDRTKLPADVAGIVDASLDRGHSPPIPPPPSTSTVDGPGGPTADRGQLGRSTVSTVSTVEGGTNG
jgi:hypothetical protein